jgi:16S rRNA (guanine527-N7)-methyltransferase
VGAAYSRFGAAYEIYSGVIQSNIGSGSGAGFPGLILAMLGDYEVNLIESDQRKCAFMQVAASQFSLRVNIINERIELINPILCDVVISRALAQLSLLCEYSYPHLKKDNFMLFLKGQNVVEEIKDASIYWDFEYKLNQGPLGQSGEILEIYNLKRR